MTISTSASSFDAFRNLVLRNFYLLARARVEDNYDAHRFSSDGVDRSAFDPDWHVRSLSTFIEHISDFHQAYSLLADDESKQLFLRLVLYRLLGQNHVRIRDSWRASDEARGIEAIEATAKGGSALAVGELFGGLKVFEDVEFLGRKLKLDCWTGSIYYALVKRQYFLERASAIVRPEPGDIVIDGGACFGDNALAFAVAAAGGHVHSFEPLPSYLSVCRHNVAANGLADAISLWPYALSDKTANLDHLIDEDGGGSPAFSIVGREDRLPTISIDDFAEQERLPSVDFIKMDVEGAELAALKGAAHVISLHRPKLAISLYHDFSDFFTIPLYLARTYPFYRFYLDHYTVHAGETVLYAIGEQ